MLRKVRLRQKNGLLKKTCSDSNRRKELLTFFVPEKLENIIKEVVQIILIINKMTHERMFSMLWIMALQERQIIKANFLLNRIILKDDVEVTRLMIQVIPITHILGQTVNSAKNICNIKNIFKGKINGLIDFRSSL